MQYRIHYKITGTFPLEVPETMAHDIPAVAQRGAEALSDTDFQIDCLSSENTVIHIIGTEPIREGD
jgi:hypothetical protein